MIRSIGMRLWTKTTTETLKSGGLTRKTKTEIEAEVLASVVSPRRRQTASIM